MLGINISYFCALKIWFGSMLWYSKQPFVQFQRPLQIRSRGCHIAFAIDVWYESRFSCHTTNMVLRCIPKVRIQLIRLVLLPLLQEYYFALAYIENENNNLILQYWQSTQSDVAGLGYPWHGRWSDWLLTRTHNLWKVSTCCWTIMGWGKPSVRFNMNHIIQCGTKIILPGCRP